MHKLKYIDGNFQRRTKESAENSGNNQTDIQCFLIKPASWDHKFISSLSLPLERDFSFAFAKPLVHCHVSQPGGHTCYFSAFFPVFRLLFAALKHVTCTSHLHFRPEHNVTAEQQSLCSKHRHTPHFVDSSMAQCISAAVQRVACTPPWLRVSNSSKIINFVARLP